MRCAAPHRHALHRGGLCRCVGAWCAGGRLGADSLADVRAAAASSSFCPRSTIRLLAQDSSEKVRAAAAVCPAATLERLARHDSDEHVRAAAAGNARCPAEVLDDIIGSGGDIRFAGGDSSYEVWVAVAENPNSPPQTLWRLLAIPDDTLTEHIAENPNCPPEIHAQIESWNNEQEWAEMDEDAFLAQDAD